MTTFLVVKSFKEGTLSARLIKVAGPPLRKLPLKVLAGIVVIPDMIKLSLYC